MGDEELHSHIEEAIEHDATPPSRRAFAPLECKREKPATSKSIRLLDSLAPTRLSVGGKSQTKRKEK